MPRGNGTGPLGVGPMTGRAQAIAQALLFRLCKSNRLWVWPERGFRRMFYATGQPRWARFGLSNINRDFASDADEKNF